MAAVAAVVGVEGVEVVVVVWAAVAARDVVRPGPNSSESLVLGDLKVRKCVCMRECVHANVRACAHMRAQRTCARMRVYMRARACVCVCADVSEDGP